MRTGRYEKVGKRWCYVDTTTKADREKHAGWTTPYATDPTCDHARGAVEVTAPFQQPPRDWSKPMGGFVIRLREWACLDCGHPVNPHAYESHQLEARTRRDADRLAVACARVGWPA